jgi:hypothetical protein
MRLLYDMTLITASLNHQDLLDIQTSDFSGLTGFLRYILTITWKFFATSSMSQLLYVLSSILALWRLDLKRRARRKLAPLSISLFLEMFLLLSTLILRKPLWNFEKNGASDQITLSNFWQFNNHPTRGSLGSPRAVPRFSGPNFFSDSWDYPFSPLSPADAAPPMLYFVGANCWANARHGRSQNDDLFAKFSSQIFDRIINSGHLIQLLGILSQF